MELGLVEIDNMKIYKPNEQFWIKWRTNKEQMKNDGYKVLKFLSSWIIIKNTSESVKNAPQ